MDLAEQSGFTNREDYKSNWITTNQIKCWFLVRRENREYTGKKPKRTEQRTNKPNPHMTAGQEIKPAPLWWNFSHRFPDPALQKTGNNEPESYSGSAGVYSFYYCKSFNTWNTSWKRSSFPTAPIEIASCKRVVKNKKAFGQRPKIVETLSFASMFFLK